jgi:hypothetical protein
MEEGRDQDIRLGALMAEVGNRQLVRPWVWIATAAVAIAAVWMASRIPNADWDRQFFAAGRSLLQGRSPYVAPTFSDPPWAAILILPFAVLPTAVGRGLMLVCTVAAWLYFAWRLRAPRIAVAAVLLSPTAIDALLAANVDAFVMLGLFLPPVWGAFLLLLKPQVGIGALAGQAHEIWRRDGLLKALGMLAPVVAALGLSALIFPPWVERMSSLLSNGWNRSLFPYSLPLGLLLLWIGFKRRNPFIAMVASPFLSPYLTWPSYMAVQMGLLHEDVERWVRRDVLQVALCAFLWVLMFTFKL